MSIGRCASKVVFVLLTFLAVSGLSSGCLACDGSVQQTWYAWQRVWHGPNALETPLRGYFIPRAAGYCGSVAYGDACGSGIDPAAIAVEPPGFERLGRIPNDLELSVGVPAARAGQPTR